MNVFKKKNWGDGGKKPHIYSLEVWLSSPFISSCRSFIMHWKMAKIIRTSGDRPNIAFYVIVIDVIYSRILDVYERSAIFYCLSSLQITEYETVKWNGKIRILWGVAMIGLKSCYWTYNKH